MIDGTIRCMQRSSAGQTAAMPDDPASVIGYGRRRGRAIRWSTSARPGDSRGTVLVVGGAGYVGNVLVRRLLAAGNTASGFSTGSIFEPRSGHRPAARASAILTRAWRHAGPGGARERPRGSHRRRAAGRAGRRPDHQDLSRVLQLDQPRRMDRGHRGARRAGDRPFVFTSTCSNYGWRNQRRSRHGGSELSPVSLYAEQKVEIERRILAAAAAGVDYAPTVLRIATAYGLSPRMRST